MSKVDLLNKLAEDNLGYLSTEVVQSNGISKTHFLEYVRKQKFERVAHGLYIAPNAWQDDMYIIQYRYPEAIFSHETSAYLLNLADREPLNLSITFKKGKGSAQLSKNNIKVYKIKKELFEIGLISIVTPMGHKIRSYNAERTLCDLMRSRSNIDVQVINSAMKTYLWSNEKNIPQLMQYAKLFSVERLMKQYMEVLL